MRIFLVGMMGSGKSYIGAQLASKLGLDFIDLDLELERIEHKKIPEIFATVGEEGFRIIEARTLRKLEQRNNFVLACGGGTPCFTQNMDWMNRVGLTIYLNPPLDWIQERLDNLEKSKRPLLSGKEDEDLAGFLYDLWVGRRLFYEEADITYTPKNQDTMLLDLLSIIGSAKKTPHLQKKTES